MRVMQNVFKVVLMFGMLCGVLEVNAQIRSVDPEILSILKSNSGKFSPKLRDKFIEKNKLLVLDSLQSSGKSISQEILDWIDSDSIASIAIYGSVSPVDPNILLNFSQLWKEQGAVFTKKYKHLTIAAAVARRGMGVTSLSSFSKSVIPFWSVSPQWQYMCSEVKNAENSGKDFQKYMHDKDSTYMVNTSWFFPRSSSDTIALTKVQDYIDANKLSYRKAFEDSVHYAKIDTILKDNGFDRKYNVWSGLRGVIFLKSDVIPQRRTVHPKVSDFNKHLVSILEKPASSLPLTDKQVWPIFPTLSAPWPLLMPLAKTIPLDECDFIWEKYLGKHGDNRLHAYGPYRNRNKTLPYFLDERPWNWESYPARIETGGKCGTMATISSEVNTALGHPVTQAPQPGHCAVMRYDCVDTDEFIAIIGQANVKTAPKTNSYWPFRDVKNATANGVHHYTFALGMNKKGLSSYMDTRIALQIYNTLSDIQKKTLGDKLLISTLKKNPYNTLALYSLSDSAATMVEILFIIDELALLIKNNATNFSASAKTNAGWCYDWVRLDIMYTVLENIENFPYDEHEIILAKVKSLFELSGSKKLKDKYLSTFKRKEIPYMELSIESAPDGFAKVAKIIDNDTGTNWILYKELPHEIIIKWDNEYDISGIKYMHALHGEITKYKIFVSNDLGNWGDPVVSTKWIGRPYGEFAYSLFEPKQGRYLKYVAEEYWSNGGNNKEAIGINEFKILYTPDESTAIPLTGALKYSKLPEVSFRKFAGGVRFQLRADITENVPCNIYNIQGKLVRAILPKKRKGKISYTVKKEGLAQQVYVVKIKLKNSTFIQKLLF